jgi:putative transposon-encoded protein
MDKQKFTVTHAGETFTGYAMIEKEAKESGNGGRVIVPKPWIGKRVRVILLEPVDKE